MFTVIILVGLILALICGVIESCIASWMIRRYSEKVKEIKCIDSIVDRHVDEIKELNLRLDNLKSWQSNLSNSIVESILVPSRACILKSCKASSKAQNKDKLLGIRSTLTLIKANVTSNESAKWIEELINEINSILSTESNPNEEL